MPSQFSGIRVWAKQGGWEWDAWHGDEVRIGCARTKERAEALARAALAAIRGAC